MGPGDLARALCGLELSSHENLLVGMQKADDAGVYKLTDELALIQTVDFFTPIVDDPELFGRIAVANSLSDVYAMGGKPICALNVVGFPVKKLPMELLRGTLRGGLAKLEEAGVALAGGHSVDNPEFLFGVSVSGLVHPDEILLNRGAKDGDALVLTKALGTGVVTTAIKAGKASAEAIARVAKSMEALNASAAGIMRGYPVHACTDVTGFGLVGHGAEMVEDSQVGLVFQAASLPVFEEAPGYVAAKLVPGGLQRNRKYRNELVEVADGVDAALTDLAFDPQTSGGLLIALPADRADDLVDALHGAGVDAAARIGWVTADLPGRMRIE